MHRQLKWNNLRKFKGLANAFFNRITLIKNQGANVVHFVFDSYIENSIKLSERLKRYKKTAISFHVIYEDTDIPEQDKLFWGSNQNKTLLQNFIRRNILKKL